MKNNKRCLIVAEASANHSRRYDTAIRLIKKAKECGADAVKFQAYTPDTLTIDVDNRYFRIKHPKWGGQTLYDLYKKAYTPWKWFKNLKRVAEDCGLIFFATAFDKTSVDFLEDLGVPIHKISSFELVDLELIEYAAKAKKPIILSTGMATIPEIREAVNTARRAGAKSITLLKCTSSYPAKPGDMNLETIPDMARRFACPVGISDHTLGITASIAAVSLGAKVVEKHFTLSRTAKGPDSFFSIEPKELRELVDNIRVIEEALGKVEYGPTPGEADNKIFRRSLFAINDIRKGEALTASNVRSIRPGYGLAPKYLKSIVGKKAIKDIYKGMPLNLGLMKK